MPRLAWATDIHLEFCSTLRIEQFAAEVRATSPDALLLAGDTATAPSLATALTLLDRLLPCPIWFVLGNHDFYKGSLAAVRAEIAARTADSPSLRWLPTAGVIGVGEETAVLGVDGWADARCGAYWGSTVRLNDFRLILELRGLDAAERFNRLNALGNEEADLLRHLLTHAVDSYRRIVVVTHVPPFAEAAWHEGQPSAPAWAPFFACKATGEVLLDIARQWADREFVVLCGHSHGAGEYAPLANLRVITGGAEYGEPRVQGVIDVG